MLLYSTYEKKQKIYTLNKVAKSRNLRIYLDFHDISQQGKEFEICGCLHDMIIYYYNEFCKKTLVREDKLLFLHEVTGSRGDLFGEDLSLFIPLNVQVQRRKQLAKSKTENLKYYRVIQQRRKKQQQMKKEQQMNNEENIKEKEPQTTDKEKQAH